MEESVQEKLLGKRVLDPREEKLFYNPIFHARSEQTQLNMYTPYSYNKWHKTNLPCPLCIQIIDEFHLIFDCPVVVSLWKEIEPLLLRIDPSPVTEQEQIFGILGNSPTIV